MKFFIRDFFSKCDQIREENLNGKFLFLSGVLYITTSFSKIQQIENIHSIDKCNTIITTNHKGKATTLCEVAIQKFPKKVKNCLM